MLPLAGAIINYAASEWSKGQEQNIVTQVKVSTNEKASGASRARRSLSIESSVVTNPTRLTTSIPKDRRSTVHRRHWPGLYRPRALTTSARDLHAKIFQVARAQFA